MQSNEVGIPLISPNFEDTRQLNERTGLSLRPGAIYKWTYDSDGKINGVEKDSQGQPVFEEIWDKMGVDPARPNSERGSFAQAVLSKQLFVSNIGGRLVDDKRLFRIVSQYMSEDVDGGVRSSRARSLAQRDVETLQKSRKICR